MSFSKSDDLAKFDFFENDTSQKPPLPCTKGGVVLYGAGDLGQLAFQYCQSTGIAIHCYLDRYCEFGIHRQTNNLPVFHPRDETLLHLHCLPVAVCVATFSYELIKDSLASVGWATVIPFYQLTTASNPIFPLTNGWLAEACSDDEIAKVQFIYESLEDECSRIHYKNFLAWHTSYKEVLDENYPIETQRRYAIQPFLDFVNNKSQFVIDVGAHHGQLFKVLTSHDVIVEHYHAFEPDPHSYQELVTNMHNTTSLRKDNIFIYSDCVASFAASSLRFHDGLNYCSKLAPDGSASVKAVTIDSMMLKPTILKYHTEGSELDCIKGSFETITTHRPVVMASIYHNRDGLCNTVEYFMSTHVNYSFYLRLHSYQGTGFFFYAIPKNP